MTKNNDPDKIKIRSFFMRRLIEPAESPIKDFAQVGIWDMNYEYLNLEELREFRRFLNETIMKMTFKTTTK